MSDKKNRGLGRGLSALMADVDLSNTSDETNPVERLDVLIPIEKIRPNPDQPRRRFDKQALDDLAQSIQEKGIIQPLILRVSPNEDDQYQIVAGERRWRAAQMARLHEVPAVIRTYNDDEVLQVAIIENIQRSDLDPIEEAAGYRQLMDRYDHSQEQLATILGKSRSHLANQLRLLNLPDQVQTMVAEGKLSAGHARTLVGNDDALSLAKKIVSAGLSVRDAEKLAQSAKSDTNRLKPNKKPTKDADTAQLEAELAASLKMKVEIAQSSKGENGKLVLHYRNLTQLDDLLRALAGF